jgi:uncharacterized membrane protein
MRRDEHGGQATATAAAAVAARRPSWDSGLVLACAVAIIAPLVVLLGVTEPALRLAVGFPLVVLVPGYALMAATCPGPSVWGAERLALSIGTSLTVAVLTGLMLHWTPWGLQPVSWSVALGGVTLVAAACTVIQWRWRSVPGGAAGAAGRAARTTNRRAAPVLHIGVGSSLLLASAALIVVGTVYLARLSATSRTAVGFTQVWMLPAGDASATTVRLGVNSNETTETQYILRLDVDGAPLQTWPSIVLGPGQTWEATAAIPAEAGAPMVAEARLYRVDGQAMTDEALSDPSGAYRRVMMHR